VAGECIAIWQGNQPVSDTTVHVLDLQTWAWTQPEVTGEPPLARQGWCVAQVLRCPTRCKHTRPPGLGQRCAGVRMHQRANSIGARPSSTLIQALHSKIQVRCGAFVCCLASAFLCCLASAFVRVRTHTYSFASDAHFCSVLCGCPSVGVPVFVHTYGSAIVTLLPGFKQDTP
jgi:hypothetical protein